MKLPKSTVETIVEEANREITTVREHKGRSTKLTASDLRLIKSFNTLRTDEANHDTRQVFVTTARRYRCGLSIKQSIGLVSRQVCL